MKSGITPLNYCRQYYAQLSQMVKGIVQSGPASSGSAQESVDKLFMRSALMMHETVKFILPDGGVILDDPELKGLEGIALKLPYTKIAIEYRESEFVQSEEILTTKSSKRIVFAEQGEEGITIMPVSWIDEQKCWIPLNPILIPSHLTSTSFRISENGFSAQGLTTIQIAQTPFIHSDYANEFIALLSFLNALACRNVTPERAIKGSKAKKGALPFDDYHVLSLRRPDTQRSSCGVGGDHRSPREHLRRGHIRRLQNGERIWVNACVVNGGAGGKIHKEYSL